MCLVIPSTVDFTLVVKYCSLSAELCSHCTLTCHFPGKDPGPRGALVLWLVSHTTLDTTVCLDRPGSKRLWVSMKHGMEETQRDLWDLACSHFPWFSPD